MLSKNAIFALARALEGLPVLGTLEGSPAAQAGVGYGDILLSVNGLRTKTMTDYVEAKNLRLDGMTIIVFRNGASVELAFDYDVAATPADPALLGEVLGKLRILSTGDGSDDPEPSS